MGARGFSLGPALAQAGGGAFGAASALDRLRVLAFIAGEGVSRKVTEVNEAMREIVDKLRQQVEGLAGQELVDKLAHEVDRLADQDGDESESGEP